MLERYTPEARRVLSDAREEATLMRHAHIGTEHVLVALARGDDVAAAMLHHYGLDGETARSEVVKLNGMGDTPPGGQLPFTPVAKEALGQTLEEAMRLGHEDAEPGHLLLAILRPQDALARRLLLNAGAAPRDFRTDLIQRLAERPRSVPRDPGSPVTAWLDEVALGDIGHPNVDGRLLLEILGRRGAVAAWLRERGVDEQAVGRMLGE
jgi:ATP-dependent Clp protease ATP-binding subunit ClpA